MDEVEAKGEYLESKLLEIKQVKSVRRMGLMVGIELCEGDVHEVAASCVKNGLLIITAKNLLRMLPPLTISRAELDEAVTILKNTLEG